MAMYHYNVTNVSKNNISYFRSAVSASAYQSGEKLYNKLDGSIPNYKYRTDIAYKEILLPVNAPNEFNNRETLWNAVEEAEKRKDSRFARTIKAALPNELTLEEQISLTKEYVLDNFVSLGMCADIAIHTGVRKDEADKPNNPHMHVLLTTRPVEKEGFGTKKEIEWNKRELVALWRKKWADIQNREFERKGLNIRVSHKSHIERGIDKEPTIHLGHKAKEMERKGVRTERGNINRDIEARNMKKGRKKERIKQHEFEMERSHGIELER